jgi:hypothetical protein
VTAARNALFFIALCAASITAACGEGGICEADELTEALATAMSGDTIRIGECEVTGSFTVPAGTRLQGESRTESKVIGEEGLAVLRAEGAGQVEIDNLSIRSPGRAAIYSSGEGERVFHELNIETTLGAGIAVEGSAYLSMNSVALTGPVTVANASAVPNNAVPASHATHGLILVGVHSANLDSVTISGFAGTGALFVTSTVTWQSGSSSDNLALGIGIESSDVTLNEVAACRTFQGSILLPAYGVVTRSSTLTSDRLRLCENEGYGLLALNGRAVLANIDATNNDNAAVWAQNVRTLELSGTILRNSFAGLVLVETEEAIVHDASIGETISATRVIEGVPYQIGDGVQVVRSTAGTVLRDVTLEDNERTGVLFELAGTTITAASLDRVSVSVATQTARGVVAQNGPRDPAWDSGVTRVGTTKMLDEGAIFEHVEAVGPCNTPRPSELERTGIGSLLGI